MSLGWIVSIHPQLENKVFGAETRRGQKNFSVRVLPTPRSGGLLLEELCLEKHSSSRLNLLDSSGPRHLQCL